LAVLAVLADFTDLAVLAVLAFLANFADLANLTVLVVRTDLAVLVVLVLTMLASVPHTIGGGSGGSGGGGGVCFYNITHLYIDKHIPIYRVCVKVDQVSRLCIYIQRGTYMDMHDGMLAGTFGWLVAVDVRCGWRARVLIDAFIAKIKVAFQFVALTAPPCWLLVSMHDQPALHALPRGVVEVRHYAAQLVDLLFQKPDFDLQIHDRQLCLAVGQLASWAVDQLGSWAVGQLTSWPVV
jgi:hypothetical protein